MMELRWVVHDGEATLRGPHPDEHWDMWFAMVRREPSGYRVVLRKGETNVKLPNRSVSMEKMMALALAHVRLGV